MTLLQIPRGSTRDGAPRNAWHAGFSSAVGADTAPTCWLPAPLAGLSVPRLPVTLLACATFGVCAPLYALDDFGAWQWNSLEFYHHDKFTATLFNELRWKDTASEFSLGLVGPLLRYQAWSHTSFALGAYYLHVPRGFNLDDTNQAWLDLEMLNTWKPSADWAFNMRTMFENRWLEDPHGMRQISRHRVGVAYTCHDLGPITKLYANNELFLDWDSGAIRENRAIPFAVSMKITPSVSLDVFPMLRSTTNGRSDWTHEMIVGTHLVWKP